VTGGFQEKENTLMKTHFSILAPVLTVLALGACLTASGQSPVISFFSQNGEFICTHLAPGSVATVEWAPAVTGPWTNTWEGLAAVTADSNGTIQMSVPMF
jgi:hypothetical protein